MEEASALRLISSRIRDIPDFPKPGILFKDITPILADPTAFRAALDLLATVAEPLRPTQVVAIESRGFIFGAPLAAQLGVGFAPVRKPGKLPYRSAREEYTLEYGSGVLEMHEDAVSGQRVLIVDDLLATGGTAAATARLCQRLGAQVAGFTFVIELGFLAGRDALDPNTPVRSLLTF
jgi:adenine phosphoribosyltransferase